MRLKLVVLNDAGMQEEWVLESGAANAIARKGLSRDDINIGDRIRVAGWPSKFGRQELFVINLLLPSGQETISDDGKRLDYEVSVTDPENLVGAATWDAAWKWVTNTKIMPFECELD